MLLLLQSSVFSSWRRVLLALMCFNASKSLSRAFHLPSSSFNYYASSTSSSTHNTHLDSSATSILRSTSTPSLAFPSGAFWYSTNDNGSGSGSGSPSFRSFLRDEDDDVELSSLSSAEEYNSEEEQLLSYLPNAGANLPPQFQRLMLRATKQYVYGKDRVRLEDTDDSIDDTTDDGDAELLTLQEIATIIEQEHRSKDVPVRVGDIVADVTKTGEELDEICAELLSVAALYRIPAEITLQLLRAPVLEERANASTIGDSSLVACQAVFAEKGWSAVSFPHGLAVRPKTKFRLFQKGRTTKQQPSQPAQQQNQPRTPLSWLHRRTTLQKAAADAVQAASQTRAPPRQLLDRQEFLQSMQAQLEGEPISIVNSAESTLPPPSLRTYYFPNSSAFMSNHSPAAGLSSWSMKQLSPRHWQRSLRKQYTALRKHGRAGLVAYCFLNFLYYTLGTLWQWRRVPAADPVTSGLAASTLLLRKAARVYAYLYAASQLVKLPKLLAAVGLAPAAQRVLQWAQRRVRFLKHRETTAAVVLIAAMGVAWLSVCGVLGVAEYARLQQRAAGAALGGLLEQPPPVPPSAHSVFRLTFGKALEAA